MKRFVFSRSKTLSESTMQADDGQSTTDRTYDTESDEEVSGKGDPKSGGKFLFIYWLKHS